MRKTLVALVLLSVGLVAQDNKAHHTPEPREGRFQIVFSPWQRADTFLLDSATGDTWVWADDNTWIRRYRKASKLDGLSKK